MANQPALASAPATGTETSFDFRTVPHQYRHWRLSFEGPVAHLAMDVDQTETAFEGYELKLNSYDIGVDIELYDATQRLRFEHPEVHTVVLSSNKPGMFCAGANIRMLGGSTHGHKVNFCKFTNETRNAIEDASDYSRQRYICAINGTAAGGGYELALATDYIILIDDGNAAVSLPEVPLLAVLPGTGGLTRVVDKRKVRRDLADVFCTLEEGIKGQRAVDWRLVDEIIPSSKFEQGVQQRALDFAGQSDRPDDAQGITLTPLQREISDTVINYPYLSAELDRDARVVTITLAGPQEPPPSTPEALLDNAAEHWLLALVRALDDLLLHLRFNEPELGVFLFRSTGDAAGVLAHDAWLLEHRDHWLVREVSLYWKRTLKRIDVSARSSFTLIDPGSCYAGLLCELLFAADRSYMLEGQFEHDDKPAATFTLTDSNFGPLPMANGLTRLQTRFLGEPDTLEEVSTRRGEPLDAEAAFSAGLITFAPDDIDWEDEIRMALEERASFSPDSLTGLEANLRFAGPETVETKIFGRLSAWQNWIFQRPNAVSNEGALKLYGTGKRPNYDPKRV
jgi:benzoyl-CoA-dihydrodiol lyase